MQDAGFVRKAFAGIASRYVLANHVLSLGIDCLWRRTTANRIVQLKPKLVLDLATGSGDLAQAIQKACPEAKVLGADFSVPMMREAQARRFHQLIAADGMALPFKDDVFDVLTVAFGLRNMASWPAALQEMSRVLRPGGTLFVLDFSIPRIPGIRQLYLFYLKHVMTRIAGWITGQREAYVYLCGSIERFPSGKEMEALICANGFQSACAKQLTFGIASLYEAKKAS
ncbi:ubiquinone/menaquinone biosynthesis methyltransferase [Prosthecobacter sp.]|jgi:demethylmenaquinone methyltransferase/2-methoxy-6-polyprenyl-1,4-benzoquinol methylase|uniref:ubiquinone/menaquinone biosynthesis methyltransferase n=1 Tax=Prosthecobacter sp. TaxID=1965333 RepID=UPI003783D1DF